MRSALLALLLVTSVFALPAAAAKSFAEDPQGDVQTNVFGAQALPGAAPGADAADLLTFDVAEDAEQLTFTVGVANLKQQVSFAQYEIRFSWQKDDYLVRVQRQVAQGVFEDDSNAYLYAADSDGGRFDGFAQLDHKIDVEAGLITVHLPKAYILSEKGRFPLLGDDLTEVYVEAGSYATLFQFTAESYDRMPDGDATLKYPFLFGDVASGHLRLDADERVRVSNGGATTFVYQVVIANKGDFDDQVALTLTELPDGWNGTVQSPLRIPGGSERRVAILMSVPFGHEHGGFSSFNVSVVSENDPQSFASIRVGVLHTPIPQPAGHHSELYLHAQKFNSFLADVFPWTGASMNTDSAHDGDAAEASPWGSDGDTTFWRIPLDPTLRMGLDFDLDKLGELTGTLVGHGSAQGTLTGELLLVTQDDQGDFDDGILLAESDAQDLTLDMSTPQAFKLTLTPTEESDYIPYARGQNMVLLLYFRAADGAAPSICCLGAGTPGMPTADFKLVLPLNEYHDKLNGLAETAETLELKAEGAVEKTGLPGSTMTYVFTLTNRGADSYVIDLDLAGTDAMLGTLVPAAAFELASKESRKVTLAVGIPSDRNDGEEIEVLVFAHAQEDPSKSAIARTKTIVAKVGSAEAASDESGVLLAAQQAESNDTPAPGAALLVLAGAAVALALRRR